MGDAKKGGSKEKLGNHPVHLYVDCLESRCYAANSEALIRFEV